MKFKLPKLSALVSSDKKLKPEDLRQYIIVINEHAIVTNDIIAIVNLRNYVKIECKISDENDLDRLNGILEWMEGKCFTKQYWDELTKENFVNLNSKDCLEIENLSYNKVLVYEEQFAETELQLKVIVDNISREGALSVRTAFNGSLITSFVSAFKNELKNDQLLIENTGEGNAVKFQLSRRDYILGLLPTNYNSASELTAFLNNADIKDKINEYLNSN